MVDNIPRSVEEILLRVMFPVGHDALRGVEVRRTTAGVLRNYWKESRNRQNGTSVSEMEACATPVLCVCARDRSVSLRRVLCNVDLLLDAEMGR